MHKERSQVLLVIAVLSSQACRSAPSATEEPARNNASKKVEPLAVAPSAWPAVDPGLASSTPLRRGLAELEPTEGSNVRGKVVFTATQDGLKVEADVEGLPSGKHAFHVHVFGDCSGKDAKTAGGHFNFVGSSLNPPTGITRITGNLGELSAGSDGKAHAEQTVERASLTGPFSIVGRAVVVHTNPNDTSRPPEGAAGSRIACGVIGVAG